MSVYNLERKTLENIINTQNCFGFNERQFGFDLGPVQEEDNNGFMTIFSGQSKIKSTGGIKLKVNTPSILAITYFFDIQTGSKKSKIKADEIVTFFFDKVLDENAGIPNENSELVLKFGVPWISSIVKEAPFIRSNINIPFNRVHFQTKS